MLNVKTREEAFALILDSFKGNTPLPENVGIAEALGRTLAEDIIAASYIPGFNRSTVDGYAVAAADTFGAGETLPAMLVYAGECKMGEKPHPIRRGECMYVPTGGELPEGAEAMVMIEDSDDYGDKYRYLSRSAAPGNYVSFRGDDARPGDAVLRAGKRLRPHDIGTLAALGVNSVNVCKKPVTGVISTGDELVEVDTEPSAAQIRDVNTYALCASISEAGGLPLPFGIMRDEPEPIKAAILRGLEECDILLLSGSSSVGSRDHARRIIGELADETDNSELLFHGVAMKPGKPLIAAKIAGKPVFGLPGHPVAAYFTFHIFVKPLIASMLGERQHTNTLTARLSVNIPSNHGREEIVAGEIKDSEIPLFVPIIGKSGLITTLSRADGYIRIARDSEGLKAGVDITVYLL